MDEPGGAPASQSSAPHVPEGEPRTRGFLFCDLRGYTDFVETHGDRAAADLLERYRAIVRAAVARTAGAEIRTEGDGFYVVFPSASPAVRCGLDIVAAAEAATAETPDRPIRVGIGIHAGESVEGAEGYVGSAVNLAARVCAAAEPGEVLVTDTVRGVVRTSLPVGFAPRGRRRLKGIAEPIALYRVTPASAVAATPVRLRPRAAVPGLLGLAALVGAAGALLLVKPWAGGGTVASPSGGTSVSASSAAATRSPDASVALSGDAVLPGRLAFLASQVIGAPEPRNQLYVVAAAGGDWQRMTELTADVFIANWSPDGSALVYTVSGDENVPPRVVEVADAPAATVHPWPFGTDVIEWDGRTYQLNTIDWSPTDELFACAGTVDAEPGRVRIFAVPPDGSTVRLVTEPDPGSPSESNDDCGASVSPDGLTIAFASGISTLGIWAAPADGAGQRLQLTEDIAVWPGPESASWSPDGSRLAFAGQRTKGGPIEIWTIDAQGTSLQRLTDDDLTDQAPAFSPDGRWIAWTRTVAAGQRQIWVMGADGSDPHPLIVGAEGEQLDLIGWAPDPG